MYKNKYNMRDLLFGGIFTASILFFAGCSGGDDPAPEMSASIQFISVPPASVDHNRSYNYQILTEVTEGDDASFTVGIPDWLQYDDATQVLSGIADWKNLDKTFNVIIEAINGIDTVTQSFSIRVNLGEILCDEDFGDPAASNYVLPFEVGEEFLLSQSYCPSNSSWGHHGWYAYDFDMPIGTRLIAMRGGEVIAVLETGTDGSRRCGPNDSNYLFVLHDDGSVAIYAHQTKNGVEVAVGDKLKQGDFIGLSGDSGCSIGPHVHVGLYKQRAPYDRQYSLPFNFRNADGKLNPNNGLIGKERYKALPF
ncbi:MAG: peptidoglycan DD-metalloendopeptidase family protein [Cyclobacteriaceae bacterium]